MKKLIALTIIATGLLASACDVCLGWPRRDNRPLRLWHKKVSSRCRSCGTTFWQKQLFYWCVDRRDWMPATP